MYCSTVGSFYDAIKPILRISQFFGIIPVDNINNNEIFTLKFQWKSIKTIYCLVFLTCASIECILCIRMGFKNGLSLIYVNTLAFYSISTLNAIFIFTLARKWRIIIEFWFEHEKVFLKAPYTVDGWSLKRRIVVWSILIGILMSGELKFLRRNLVWDLLLFKECNFKFKFFNLMKFKGFKRFIFKLKNF